MKMIDGDSSPNESRYFLRNYYYNSNGTIKLHSNHFIVVVVMQTLSIDYFIWIDG